MCRVVGPNAAVHRIAENRAEQAHRAGGRCLTTCYTSEAPLSGRLCPDGCFSIGNIVHKSLNIVPSDGGNGQIAEQRLYVPLDPALIDRECARLLRRPVSGEYPTRLCIDEVQIA
jgi:hypothetical protein